MDTKTCPQCGNSMIKEYWNVEQLGTLSKYPFEWVCGCGYYEEGVDNTREKPNLLRRWFNGN